MAATVTDLIRTNPKLLTDMELYHRSLDWADLWYRFQNDIAPSGLPKYPNVRQFILVYMMPKSALQEEFSCWYLGPDRHRLDLEKKYSKFAGKPQDWDKRRSTGGWWIPEVKDVVLRKLRAEEDALAISKERGHETWDVSMIRANALEVEAYRNFGPWYRQDLTEQENFVRVSGFLGILEKIRRYKEGIQECQLESLGLGKGQPEQLTVMIANRFNGATMVPLEQQQEARRKDICVEINRMMLNKTSKFNAIDSLPQDVKQKIIDVAASNEEAESSDLEKKKVQ